MIFNIGRSNHHINCFYSEGKDFNSNDLKIVAKYAFSQAPSKLKIGWKAPGWIVGSGVTLTTTVRDAAM